jgi:hypothetical protein
VTRWLAEWRSLAPLSRFGVLVIGLGVAADTVTHLSAGTGGGAIGFTPAQHAAHLVILLGMVGVLIGIILNAIWPARHRRSLRK